MKSILMILIAFLLLGATEPPSSSSSAMRHDQKATAAAPDDHTAKQDRGSSEIPFVVKVIPTELTESERDNERHEREKKAASDEHLVALTADLAHYTGALFVATLFLAVITGGLVYVGFRQVRDAKAAIDAAVKSASAAEKAANAAEAQAAITSSQTDILIKQHAVGRLEFLATHRPKIRVRHVTLEESDIFGDPTMFFDDGNEIKGSLVLVNQGGTNAKITYNAYKIFFSRTGLPAKSPIGIISPGLVPSGTILEIGQAKLVEIKDMIVMHSKDSLHSAAHGAKMIRQFTNEKWKVYVMGSVRYEDEAGHERFMGFCRERGSDGKFSIVADADYEYEE